jgi:hypothetical protein
MARAGTAPSARARTNSPDRSSDTPSGTSSAARDIVRRLIGSRPTRQKRGDTAARAAAAACDSLYRELSRWVGPDGCHALFARALAETRPQYPALEKIQLRPRSEPYIEGISDSIMMRGDPETAEALESMLMRLVELLGRLIGDDMAGKLIDRTFGDSEQGSDDTREEA